MTEQCYEAQGLTWLQDLLQDLRYGVGMLIKNRAFACATNRSWYSGSNLSKTALRFITFTYGKFSYEKHIGEWPVHILVKSTNSNLVDI